jgi:limonene-1,2-epoxide hydrolase
MIETMLNPETSRCQHCTPDEIVRRVLCALNKRDLSTAIGYFDEHFIFADHALDFSFTDKHGLRDFLQKTLDMFPDTLLDVESTSACGDRVVAMWKLTATKDHEFIALFKRRTKISVQGVSIVQVINESVVSWSDYYDANRSWRCSLAGLFTDF